jgi:hypothetical protein
VAHGHISLRLVAGDEGSGYLLIPVLDPDASAMEVLNVSRDDHGVTLKGVGCDKHISIPVGAATRSKGCPEVRGAFPDCNAELFPNQRCGQIIESRELSRRVLDHQLPPDFIEHDWANDEERVPPDLLAETVKDTLISRMFLEKLGDRIGVE